MNETVAGEIVRAARALRGAARVLVVAHSGPDPDAYGSSCGLTLALQAAGQEACCLNQDGAVQGYLYLPGVSAVEQQVPPGPWDLIVFCDCAEKRAGRRFPFTTTAGWLCGPKYRSSLCESWVWGNKCG